MGASPALADGFRQIKGVDTVSTLRFASSSTEANSLMAGKFSQGSSPSGQQEMAVSILGIDPVAYPKVSGLYFAKGNEKQAYTELSTGRNAIINGVLAAAAGLKIGDELVLSTPQGKQSYQVVAIASDFLDAKIQVAYISQANLKADFNKDEDIFIQINLTKDADRASVDAQIKALTAQYPQFQLIAGREYYEENRRLFNVAFSGMYVVLAFLALPSLIAMTNTLAIAVIERTREIGMLRAVGTTRRQVRTMIMAEALLLASIGTAFGLLGGLYLGYVLVDALKTLGYPVFYSFPLAGILAGIAVGLLFGVIAALIPARQAAGMRIVEALRYE